MAPAMIKDKDELMAVFQKYTEVHLFFGYGTRAQYQSPKDVLAALHPHLSAIRARSGAKPWLAVYGGDLARESEPDIGWIMKLVQDNYNCHLLAVQAAGTPDTHTNHCFVTETQYEEVVGSDGKKVKEVLYGGTRDGKLVGGSRYYLSDELITRNPSTHARLLKGLFILGGGGVALDEVKYADQHGLPWTYIPCRLRHEKSYPNMPFGPVHSWFKDRFDQGGFDGAGNGIKYLTLSGNTYDLNPSPPPPHTPTQATKPATTIVAAPKGASNLAPIAPAKGTTVKAGAPILKPVPPSPQPVAPLTTRSSAPLVTTIAKQGAPTTSATKAK